MAKSKTKATTLKPERLLVKGPLSIKWTVKTVDSHGSKDDELVVFFTDGTWEYDRNTRPYVIQKRPCKRPAVRKRK